MQIFCYYNAWRLQQLLHEAAQLRVHLLAAVTAVTALLLRLPDRHHLHQVPDGVLSITAWQIFFECINYF